MTGTVRGAPALAEAVVGALHRRWRPMPALVRRCVATVLLCSIVYGVGTALFPRVVLRSVLLPRPTSTHTQVMPAPCGGWTRVAVVDGWRRGDVFWQLVRTTSPPLVSTCI